MHIEIIKPHKLLNQFIKYYWVLEGDFKNHIELIYPTGELQILLHYGSPFYKLDDNEEILLQPNSAFYGHGKSISEVYAGKGSGVIGIVFFPYSASLFFPFSLHEVKSEGLLLSDVNKDWNLFEDKIFNTDFLKPKIDIIDKFLLSKLTIHNQYNYEIIKESIGLIKHTKGKINVNNIHERFDISERTLQRIFKRDVGLTPKQFIKIIRMENIFQLLQSKLDLTFIAYEAGYADQSHFIHDFKSFTKLKPSEFRKKYLAA